MVLPHRAPQSLLETLGTTAILFKCHHWAFVCWKEVGEWVRVSGSWGGIH